jgi:hypothetical protein
MAGVVLQWSDKPAFNVPWCCMAVAAGMLMVSSCCDVVSLYIMT